MNDPFRDACVIIGSVRRVPVVELGFFMMLDIIRRHNRLNGVIFCLVEFALMGIFVGVFAGVLFLKGRLDLGLIGSGIAINCIPVIVCGVNTILYSPQDLKLGTIWNRDARATLKRENPHMMRETLILSGATLVPFFLAAAALYGLRHPRAK